jgi:hypothetical protein
MARFTCLGDSIFVGAQIVLPNDSTRAREGGAKVLRLKSG